MPSAVATRAILHVDNLRLRRDRLLLALVAYVVGISVAMRWAIPWMTSGAEARWDFDLEPYHALIMSHLLVQLAPQLVGILGGFLLLESREDRTVKAVLVSPVPMTSYLWVVGSVMVVAAALLVVVEGLIIGVALPPLGALLGAAVAGAPAAAGFAFLVAALAQDKTQAFAYMKIFGIAPLIPTAAYFVAEPLQWVAGLYPSYWASKAYWVAEAGSTTWPLWVLGGVVVSAMWVTGLARFYAGVARR